MSAAGSLSTVNNLIATAEPLCDIGPEYQTCRRCGENIQDYVSFEAREISGNYPSRGKIIHTTFCYPCWNVIVKLFRELAV